MSVVATIMRELIALGVSGDALVAAVDRIADAVEIDRARSVEDAVTKASEKADRELAERRSRAAERTRKWRDHKDAVISPSVTVISPTVTERHPTCEPAQVDNSSLPSLRSEEVKTPTEPIGSAPPKVAKPKKPRVRICPPDWLPTAGDLAVGAEEGFTSGEIERELAKFRDHEFRDPHSEWSPTFRKWLRNAAERRPRQAHERPHTDAKLAAKQANYARAWEGSERASRFRGEP